MTGGRFDARAEFGVDDSSLEMYRVDAVDAAARLPYRLKVLLENLLRNEDGEVVTADQVRTLANQPAGAGRAVLDHSVAVPAGRLLANHHAGNEEKGNLTAEIAARLLAHGRVWRAFLFATCSSPPSVPRCSSTWTVMSCRSPLEHELRSVPPERAVAYTTGVRVSDQVQGG